MSAHQTADPDVVVLREGTEGLSMASYADALRERLPDRTVALARTPAEERDLVPTARAVTGITIDADLLDRADRLELFACTFAGTDHVPTDALREHGVSVTNAGGIHAPGIAEQALGQMLVFARDLHEAWRRQGNGEWRHFGPREFTGSTVTVVGLGSIGRALAQRLQKNERQRIQLMAFAAGSEDNASRARRLSLSRALAVRSYLIDQGIRSTRMDVRALGNTADSGPMDRVDIVPAQR